MLSRNMQPVTSPICASFQSTNWSSECLFLQINFTIASAKEKENSFQILARIELVLQINLCSQSSVIAPVDK